MEKGTMIAEAGGAALQQNNQENKEIPTSVQATSPKTPCTSTTTSGSSSSNGRSNTSGNHLTNNSLLLTTTPPSQQQPPQLATTPKSLPLRSDSTTTTNPANPYPTTFVQADASSFKQVVQMLTGSSEMTASKQQQQQMPSTTATLRSEPLPPSRSGNNMTGPKRPPFKLYERRGHGHHNSAFKSLKIVNKPLVPGLFANVNGSGSNIINISGSNSCTTTTSGSSSSNPNSPNTTTTGCCFSPLGYNYKAASAAAAAAATAGEMPPPSPSVVLDFPSLCLSPPVTPNPPFSPEERAIAEKGFYLHPSPRSGDPPPRLLPLFPVTSPRARGDSSSI